MRKKFDESLFVDGGTIELSQEMDALINKKIGE